MVSSIDDVENDDEEVAGGMSLYIGPCKCETLLHCCCELYRGDNLVK